MSDDIIVVAILFLSVVGLSYCAVQFDRVTAPAYAEYKRVTAIAFAHQYIAQGGAQ